LTPKFFISLTDRRQRLITNSLFYIANIEDTWC